MRTVATLALGLVAILCPPVSAHESRVPAGFAERRADFGGIGINYVRGGHHPQTWYEWRGLLPELGEH
ncbi:hypothetical protein [Dactylosporangium sp. CA-233914]|uniref:hypothetical protein n=1 Tax=Dactylosporangium sp. CA-233914 TaxID=3239934 RepID=UPI003D8E8D53